MKTSIALLLALFLMASLFTGCGEDNTTVVTTTAADLTTTIAEETGTTVSDDATTSTVADATTTKWPTTDHANGTGGTTATPTTTTAAKPTGTVYIVDPKNYKDNYYYVGDLQPDGDGLVRPRILFEGEYAVIMHYTYSAVKEHDDQQPFEYQGKIYYGQGEGMSPCTFEMTSTEIVIKSTNDSSIAMKLVLRSDGTMFVTHTTDRYFPDGLILTPTAQ